MKRFTEMFKLILNSKMTTYLILDIIIFLKKFKTVIFNHWQSGISAAKYNEQM